MTGLPADITIRTGATSDAADLSRVAARLFFETYVEKMPVKDLESHVAGDFGYDRQLAELKDPDVTTLLAERSGELIGYAQIRRKSLPVETDARATIELWRIYVDRSCHGLGIGKLLLSKVMEVTRQMSCERIWLGVWERNPRAISFYEKHNFEIVGSQEFRIGNEVHNDILMSGSADAF